MQSSIVRSFQTSTISRDIDSAAKFIGAGAATVGVAGSGMKLHFFFFWYFSMIYFLKQILHCRSWCWFNFWILNPWLHPKSIPETAMFCLCHPWFCTVRSNGSLLLNDSIPYPLCLLIQIPPKSTL